jgi:DNA-binding NarL/FixJ family response regulator
MARLNVLIIDDHVVTASGLKLIIVNEFPTSNCEIAQTVSDGWALFERNKYDLIVLDMNIPGASITTLIDNIKLKKPTQKIMIFSMNPETVFAKRFLKMGVKGFVNKENPPEVVVSAIRTILANGMYLSDKLVQKISDDFLFSRTDNPFDKLSQRELEVCAYLIKGYTLSDISTIMQLHKSTIGTHRTRIFEKLGIKKIFELRELASEYNIPLYD